MDIADLRTAQFVSLIDWNVGCLMVSKVLDTAILSIAESYYLRAQEMCRGRHSFQNGSGQVCYLVCSCCPQDENSDFRVDQFRLLLSCWISLISLLVIVC